MMRTHKGDVDEVRVSAAARLHMGFLDLNGGLNRRFGSIGVGITGLPVALTARRADRIEVGGADCARAADVAKAALDYFRINAGVSLDIKSLIPQHQGLGSGTQLCLSVGAAITTLYGVKANVEEIARATGRGGRSGVGLGVFKHGGFVVDSGRSAGSTLPVLIGRYTLPRAWRFVLIFDEGRAGISGQQEREVFDSLPDLSAAVAAQICRLTLMQVLPAILESDCQQFGRAISSIQTLCGEHFKQPQGGLFASDEVRRALEFLQANQATGGGQTSWGPTGFAIFPDERAARAAMRRFAMAMTRGSKVRLQLARARNSKARVSRGKKHT